MAARQSTEIVRRPIYLRLARTLGAPPRRQLFEKLDQEISWVCRKEGMAALRNRRTDQRRYPRHARRIPCEIWIRGVRHTGIVKDVSSGGLFVQTRAKAVPGTELTVVISPGTGRTEIRLTGRVARTDRVGAHLAMQSAAGLGIEAAQVGALGRLIGDPALAEASPHAGES